MTNVASDNFSDRKFCIKFLLVLVLIVNVCITCAKLVGERAAGTIRTMVGFLMIFVLSTSFVTCTPGCVDGVGSFSSSVDDSTLALNAGVILPSFGDGKGSDISLVESDLFSVRMGRP